MRSNIFKVSERGERLDSLQDKTDNLAVSAQGFRRGANRVRKQMWWKDMKMRVCLVICVIILLVVIIVPVGMWIVPEMTFHPPLFFSLCLLESTRPRGLTDRVVCSRQNHLSYARSDSHDSWAWMFLQLGSL